MLVYIDLVRKKLDVVLFTEFPSFLSWYRAGSNDPKDCSGTSVELVSWCQRFLQLVGFVAYLLVHTLCCRCLLCQKDSILGERGQSWNHSTRHGIFVKLTIAAQNHFGLP